MNASIRSFTPFSLFNLPRYIYIKAEDGILKSLLRESLIFLLDLNFNKSTPHIEPLPKTKVLFF